MSVAHSSFVSLVSGFPFSYACSIFTYFVQLFCHYSDMWFFFLSDPCCSHALGILCGIHTYGIGSLLLAFRTRWSLAFRGEIVFITEALLLSTDGSITTLQRALWCRMLEWHCCAHTILYARFSVPLKYKDIAYSDVDNALKDLWKDTKNNVFVLIILWQRF